MTVKPQASLIVSMVWFRFLASSFCLFDCQQLWEFWYQFWWHLSQRKHPCPSHEGSASRVMGFQKICLQKTEPFGLWLEKVTKHQQAECSLLLWGMKHYLFGKTTLHNCYTWASSTKWVIGFMESLINIITLVTINYCLPGTHMEMTPYLMPDRTHRRQRVQLIK
jgi:hypothetical protein